MILARNWVGHIFVVLALFELIKCKVIINSTQLSTPRSAVAAIQAGQKIFFAGGFELDDFLSSNIIDVYNLEENAWDPPLTLQQPNANLNPAVLEDLTYFIGGRHFINNLNVFNTENNSFTSVDTPFRNVGEISLHNKILTVVGSQNIHFYDINGNNWTENGMLRDIMASLTAPLVIPAVNFVFIIGGRNRTSDQISNSFYIFNRDTNELRIRSTNLQIATDTKDPTTKRTIFHHFNNDVLVINQNSTTLLYHVIYDRIDHLELVAFNFARTLRPDLTFLFPVSKNGIIQYRWSNVTTLGYSTLIDQFLIPLGDDDNVGYISNSQGTFSVIRLADSTITIPLGNNSIDWSGPVKVYSWPPNRFIFAGSDSVLVIHITAIVKTSFSLGAKIQKIFVTPDEVFIFTEPTIVDCVYTISEVSFNYQMTSYECLDTPDLMINGSFLYLSAGIGVQWPSRVPFGFSPIDTADLLIEQEEDQLVTIRKTPQAVMSQLIEVYNSSNNGTWLEPINLPSELISDGENNIVVTSLNNNILALFNAYNVRFESPQQYEVLGGVGYSVSGNSFSYLVHSQVAAVIGNNVYMKSFNNSQQHFVVFNIESGWSNTTQFPNVVEPKQLFAYNNVIYMIAKDLGSNLFERVYLYYTDSQSWQITEPGTTISSLTAAVVGDFLALLADDGKLYSLHFPSGIWNADDIQNTLMFSNVVQASDGRTFVSGAVSSIDGRFSDVVLVLTDDGVAPDTPQTQVIEPSTQPSANLDNNTTLIVAIVVPVGVVLIAGALVAFFLVRRKNQKRKRGQETSVVGLEVKYGQWFTPFDQLKFGEQIGQGGNGQVFKGTWKNTIVALKVSMTQANTSVIGELELMMQMRPHPNVVQLLGFSIHPETDSIILIIEYCNEGSLDRTLFEANRPISIEEKEKWIGSVAKGLLHLHSNNIVHRDVAARNILLHQNEPKITDFGMSRLISDDNKKGTTKSELGPIRWMAPEALRSKEYSTKSDIWSLGVLIYEVIAQQEPHSDADPIEVGRLIRDNGLTPVIPDSCPEKLKTITKQCWSVNPDQRPSIEQILKHLEQ